MSEPLFLSRIEVERIHSRSIQQFGGTLGLRDTDTLEAAIFAAQNIFFYGNGDLYDIAAAYCFHIAEAQAFLDGNKRTTVGVPLHSSREMARLQASTRASNARAMISIAKHEIGKPELADLLRRLSKGEAG